MMGAKIDLAGQRFGRLVVEREGVRNKQGRIMWNCKCDCGNKVVVSRGDLKSNHTRSCGCLARELSSARNKEDLSGKRFGRLVAITDVGRSKDGTVLWKCKCDCGNEIIVSGRNLKSKNTKSCGCYQKQRASETNKVWPSRKAMRKSPVTEKSILFKKIPECDSPLIDSGGFVVVKCKMCGRSYQPTYSQVKTRINSYNGKVSGEGNFYCSDQCKNACPIFGVHPNRPDPRLRKLKPETQKTRSCQTKTLKQLQCDQDNGQSSCERCGDFIDVETHHTLPIAEYGEQAINPASHMLLCAGCHVELHRVCP